MNPLMHRATVNLPGRPVWAVLLVACLAAGSGCHDGLMYGLKASNPYYSMKQWKEDEAYGPTDHVRRQELAKLVKTIGSLPADRQQYWYGHLQMIMEHDASPEMRRLAMQAAGNCTLPAATNLLAQGLNDDSLKVRLTACERLGARADPEAARLLAELAGSTTDQDVLNAALAALGNHSGSTSLNALRFGLENRDPATRSLAMESLRSSTGQDLGNDPREWIAAIDSQSLGEPSPVRFADRLWQLVR